MNRETALRKRGRFLLRFAPPAFAACRTLASLASSVSYGHLPMQAR